MKVSVFIPVYNTEQYIARTIESVLAQTFTDWELIIVDDCSTDGTYAICLEYAAKDHRIKLYRNEQNLGMMANWRHGISYCSGSYWGKLDADDLWHPDMILDCVRILDAGPDIGMVAARYVNINEQGAQIRESEYHFPQFAENRPVSFIPFVMGDLQDMFSHHIAQQGIGLIRREIFDELGNFTLLPAGDTEMWFRIGAHYKIFCLDKLMHFHRVWQQSFTRTQVLQANKLDKNLFDVRNAIYEYYMRAGIMDKRQYKEKRRRNLFEYNKTRIADFRKKRNFVRAAGLLIVNLGMFPRETFRFYLGRLGERKRGLV